LRCLIALIIFATHPITAIQNPVDILDIAAARIDPQDGAASFRFTQFQTVPSSFCKCRNARFNWVVPSKICSTTISSCQVPIRYPSCRPRRLRCLVKWPLEASVTFRPPHMADHSYPLPTTAIHADNRVGTSDCDDERSASWPSAFLPLFIRYIHPAYPAPPIVPRSPCGQKPLTWLARPTPVCSPPPSPLLLPGWQYYPSISLSTSRC